MDPLRHPDLISISRIVRLRFDETLRAEQEAAHRANRRGRTLRDCLLEADDRNEPITVYVDGSSHTGFISGVGIDHVALDLRGRERTISLHRIAWMETHPAIGADGEH